MLGLKSLSRFCGHAFHMSITWETLWDSITWEFSTAGAAAHQLVSVRFKIDAFEENIQPSEGGSIYISDINLLGIVREVPTNTIFRYDGEVWDADQTSLSDDGGIVAGNPHELVQNYETNSAAVRLYCLTVGDVYVWGIGADDPYGGESVPRVIISW